MIGEAGRGVVVLLRDTRQNALSDQLRKLSDMARSVGHADPQAHGHPPTPTLRDYGIGAQILLDLGIKDMILLSNTHRSIVGLEGYGLNIVDERPLMGTLHGEAAGE